MGRKAGIKFKTDKTTFINWRSSEKDKTILRFLYEIITFLPKDLKEYLYNITPKDKIKQVHNKRAAAKNIAKYLDMEFVEAVKVLFKNLKDK